MYLSRRVGAIAPRRSFYTRTMATATENNANADSFRCHVPPSYVLGSSRSVSVGWVPNSLREIWDSARRRPGRSSGGHKCERTYQQANVDLDTCQHRRFHEPDRATLWQKYPAVPRGRGGGSSFRSRSRRHPESPPKLVSRVRYDSLTGREL